MGCSSSSIPTPSPSPTDSLFPMPRLCYVQVNQPYISVYDQILYKAAIYGYDMEHVTETLSYTFAESRSRYVLDTEQRYKAEKWAWQHLFPSEKDTFPGIKPSVVRPLMIAEHKSIMKQWEAQCKAHGTREKAFNAVLSKNVEKLRLPEYRNLSPGERAYYNNKWTWEELYSELQCRSRKLGGMNGLTFDHLVPANNLDPEGLAISIIEKGDDGGEFADEVLPFKVDAIEYTGKKVLAVPRSCQHKKGTRNRRRMVIVREEEAQAHLKKKSTAKPVSGV
ncbi:hypothetical protein B7494_g3350 [Chlorociboria aeruginascens]|nr:hypothetical protein B7494_g3350 [Chlorociboria aeruginascens]